MQTLQVYITVIFQFKKLYVCVFGHTRMVMTVLLGTHMVEVLNKFTDKGVPG